MNATPNTTARHSKRFAPRDGNVVPIRVPKGKLTKPSRSELRWLKASVPTIGASQDDRDENGGTQSASA